MKKCPNNKCDGITSFYIDLRLNKTIKLILIVPQILMKNLK